MFEISRNYVWTRNWNYRRSIFGPRMKTLSLARYHLLLHLPFGQTSFSSENTPKNRVRNIWNKSGECRFRNININNEVYNFSPLDFSRDRDWSFLFMPLQSCVCFSLSRLERTPNNQHSPRWIFDRSRKRLGEFSSNGRDTRNLRRVAVKLFTVERTHSRARTQLKLSLDAERENWLW